MDSAVTRLKQLTETTRKRVADWLSQDSVQAATAGQKQAAIEALLNPQAPAQEAPATGKKKAPARKPKKLSWLERRALSLLVEGETSTGDAWYKAFWYRRCYQFADYLSKFTDMNGLAAKVNQGDKATKANASLPSGQSTEFAGYTLTQLGSLLKEQPDLLPTGAIVHVKMTYDVKDSYNHEDDFHHWVTYMGHGRFTDSEHDKVEGSKIDSFLRAWVKNSFWKNEKGYQFAHLHNEEFGRFNESSKRWEANEKFQVPPISIIYTPKK